MPSAILAQLVTAMMSDYLSSMTSDLRSEIIGGAIDVSVMVYQ